MKYKKLIIEQKDFVYLKSILKVSGFDNNFETRNSLKKLEEELNDAKVVSEIEMPSDVVRFNSEIKVLIDGQTLLKIQLVKPALKDLKKNKISILTPMGSALIGYAKCDKVLWNFPKGQKTIEILEVKQTQNTQQAISV